MGKAASLYVTVAAIHHTEDGKVVGVKAAVSYDPEALVATNVSVNADTGAIDCACGLPAETGQPCVEALAVIRMQRGWSAMDLKWYDQVWHTSTWERTYYGVQPPVSTVDRLSPTDATDLLPPVAIRRPGATRKRKRRGSQPAQGDDQPAPTHTCSLCGSRGHNASSCEAPKAARVVQRVRPQSVARAAEELLRTNDSAKRPCLCVCGEKGEKQNRHHLLLKTQK